MSTKIVDKWKMRVYFPEMEFRIAYGWKRRENEFDGLKITPLKYYIDTRDTGREELRMLVAALQPHDTVVILSKSDLGRGFEVEQRLQMLRDTGATIEIVGLKRDTSAGRPSKVHFTPEQEEWACKLWRDPLREKATVLSRIRQETGQTPNRDQMNYLCFRKPKRQAEAKNKAKD